LLEPWQKFIIYNLFGLYHKGTQIRVYKEAFDIYSEKNGKNQANSCFAWALALLERKSGSKIYIVGAALGKPCNRFQFYPSLTSGRWAKRNR